MGFSEQVCGRPLRGKGAGEGGSLRKRNSEVTGADSRGGVEMGKESRGNLSGTGDRLPPSSLLKWRKVQGCWDLFLGLRTGLRVREARNPR